jgi:hypothetical protein
MVTDILARSIHREMIESARKPKAYPTRFRHSDAGKCGRYLWYEHLEVSPSDPVDVSGAWVMWLGTMLHQELQRALPLRFPAAQIEPGVRHGDLTSGHLDAKIVLQDGTKICYELKTRGSYGFDKAIGVDRKGWKERNPEGPSSSDRIQGALGATAMDADLLVIGIIGMESLSKGLADRLGRDDLARTVGEWHFDKAEFSPWAERELNRLQWIDMQISEGIVPDRIAIGDELEAISLDPAKPSWQCQYCRHWQTCKERQ